jgi:eukaryotic-like serine/threonine-protein kinase
MASARKSIRKSSGRATAPGRRGARSAPATPPAPKARIQDRGELARGGMGVIRKVFDTRIERHAALKVIDPELATHPEALGRFLDEARIAGQLDHPNIVPVYDVDVDGAGIPISFQMKLIDVQTLTVRIGRHAGGRDHRELAKLLEIFLKVCDAVAFAHSRGVIHRDLKPDNVMIGEFGQVYVMDWGCAHVLPGRRAKQEGRPRRTFLEQDGTVIGTPGYMAPEQARGQTAKLDERTDVFGLGGILYHILTGDAPYPGETTSGAVELARRGAPKPPPANPALVRIAMRALAADRDDRFESVEDLRTEVERFLRGGSFFDSRTFSPGTVIIREGDAAEEAYVLTEGHCEAFRRHRGKRIPLRTFGPGDVFGEGAIFAAGARNASVVALDQVTALVVAREILHEELALDSWMGSFVRALAVRYRDLESRSRMVARSTERARLVAAIVDHITRAGAWVRTGVLETSWSRLWGALAADLRVTEATALDVVAHTRELAYDEARDTIQFDMPTETEE